MDRKNLGGWQRMELPPLVPMGCLSLEQLASRDFIAWDYPNPLGEGGCEVVPVVMVSSHLDIGWYHSDWIKEQPTMSELMNFQTARLQLRPFEPEDLPALASLLNHPGLAGRRYLPWGLPNDLPLSRKQVESVLSTWGEEKKEFHLAILLRESGELVGHAMSDWGWDPHSPFLALVISPDHWRRGYGGEVARYLLRYLYETTPAHSISTWVAGWNEPGLLFARKAGFLESGRSRCEGIRAGLVYDEILFDLLRPEWQGRSEGEVADGARG